MKFFCFLEDHSACTPRRCEVCPARNNSENPSALPSTSSRNGNFSANDFSFEHDRRNIKLETTRNSSQRSESPTAATSTNGANVVPEIKKEPSDDSDDDDDDDNLDEMTKEATIRKIKTKIDQLDDHEREKFSHYHQILQQLNENPLRGLLDRLQVVLSESRVRRRVLKRLRPMIDQLDDKEKEEFVSTFKRTLKALNCLLRD